MLSAKKTNHLFEVGNTNSHNNMTIFSSVR